MNKVYTKFLLQWVTNIGGGSYWAGRAAARPLLGPCGPPLYLARPLFRLWNTMCWSAKRYLIVHFALFNCADTFGPILLRFHSKTMQDLRCKTSNFFNMTCLLFIVVHHKRALQRFELQLVETKIISHEKVQSARPNTTNFCWTCRGGSHRLGEAASGAIAALTFWEVE